MRLGGFAMRLMGDNVAAVAAAIVGRLTRDHVWACRPCAELFNHAERRTEGQAMIAAVRQTLVHVLGDVERRDWHRRLAVSLFAWVGGGPTEAGGGSRGDRPHVEREGPSC